MSTPNIPDPNDDSWLKMPLNIPPLQAIAPDTEIVDIDSPDKASGAQRENEGVEEMVADEEEDKAREFFVEEEVSEGETVEEVFEDSFGEIPDILLPSLQQPLRGKFKLPREEDTDEEGEEVEEMPPKDIIGELERRKKKKQEEEKAKAVGKSGPSAQSPITKTSQPTGSKVFPPIAPASKRPHSSTVQTKETATEKRQKTTATGSGDGTEFPLIPFGAFREV
ncbi:hypothetical protein RHGRI_010776 [Rhododendron griersonianum]|uniref:Uncharacterized protein n=1 Tax=Rhododendron griersonianum TaxID=479676 RepID=A0AAV6KJS5_9ERIC|nr:hypothetical protein RHGRI_010776 [Rhododendron griersonianum]